MEKKYIIKDHKNFRSAPLNRTSPFPEKGSLFDYYGEWIKKEELTTNLIDTTTDIIINVLYDLSRKLKDDIWKNTNLKFYIRTNGSSYDRSLSWYIGFDSSHKAHLGSLFIFEQTIMIKSELTEYETCMFNMLENSFDKAYARSELDILEKNLERDKLFNRLKHKFTGFSDEEISEYDNLQKIENIKHNELKQFKLDYNILKEYLKVYRKDGRRFLETRIGDFYKEKPMIQLYK